MIALATSTTSENLTSPTVRNPCFFVASGTRLIPTSMTTVPGRTIAAVTNSARPIAATRMSAVFAIAGRSRVAEWHTVTVAFAPSAFCTRRAARGFPTMLLRPRITTCFPPGSFPLRRRISTTPEGVAGANLGVPIRTRPTFSGWKQSTSFPTATEDTARIVEMCGGRGCWTRIPWIPGSSFNLPTSRRRRASVTSAGSWRVTERRPISSHACDFIFTYRTEAGSSPTITAASPGVTPRAFRAAMWGRSSARTSSAIRLPSMIVAPIGPARV